MIMEHEPYRHVRFENKNISRHTIYMISISLKAWLTMIVISLIFTYMEYHLFVADLNVSLSQKAVYLSIDIFHCFIYVFLFYLFYNPACDLVQLTVLNTLYLIIVCFFYFYRRCILTIYAEQGIGLTKERGWIGPFDRLYYLFSGDTYTPKHHESTHDWMDGNKPTILALIALNVICLVRRIPIV